MNIDRVIELQKEQLGRYEALKKSCDTYIDDEIIKAQIDEIIKAQMDTINILLYYRELIR